MTEIPTIERQAQAIRERAPLELRQQWERGEIDTPDAYRKLSDWDSFEEQKRLKRLEGEHLI